MLQLLSAPLAASFLLAAPASVAVEASAPAPGTVAVSAEMLLDRPELWLGETRTTTVQLCRTVEDWNPFLTRFDPDVYACFEVWADEQWLWIREEYDAPALRVFARAGSVAESILSGARAHGRFEVDLVLREIHAGEAWIEVVAARWTDEQTPEGTILHAIRAIDMIDREGWTLASSELERALAPNLPGHVRRELETIKATCDEVLEERRRKKASSRARD